MANPLAWWGVIRSAVLQRATTAELWRQIRDFSERHEVPLPAGMFRAVNELRATAVRIREAAASLGIAEGSAALTSDFIVTAPWARPEASRQALRIWDAKVQVRTRVGETESTRWVTVTWTGAIPPTVGDLRDQIASAAADFVESYGEGFAGVNFVELWEV